MCLCGGISIGAHRDKKRVLDDPGPGGCDLDDVSAGKVSKCSNHRAISPHDINNQIRNTLKLKGVLL